MPGSRTVTSRLWLTEAICRYSMVIISDTIAGCRKHGSLDEYPHILCSIFVAANHASRQRVDDYQRQLDSSKVIDKLVDVRGLENV